LPELFKTSISFVMSYGFSNEQRNVKTWKEKTRGLPTHFVENNFSEIHRWSKNKWLIPSSKVPLAFLVTDPRSGGSGVTLCN
jgi:hypothetical protein